MLHHFPPNGCKGDFPIKLLDAGDFQKLAYPSRTLQEEIKKHGKDALYFPSFEEAEKYLSEKCIDGDLLITMGAGNVVEIGEHLVQK